ncbi:MAG: S8 family serine peptidase [Dehalococcoidia bacterium]
MRIVDRPSSLRRLTVRLILLAFLSAFALLADSNASGQNDPPGRLDSRLEQVADVLADRGPAAALANAESAGLEVESGNVRVIVEATPGRSAQAQTSAANLGTVEVTHGSLVQVTVPPAALQSLARAPGVIAVRPPLTAYPAVVSQGVALTNADDWHTAGLTGAGVKVGILDLGFTGYESKLGTELPASVSVMSFVFGGDIYGGTAHGTGVAEIVHDMAPGAQLFFANFSTEAELVLAVEWLADQGVVAINASWGYPTSGPGDGTGEVDEIVADSVAGGVFWAVAAGNHAAKHWSGTFRDTNANGFHEFALSPFDEGNQPSTIFGLTLSGETIAGELRWNDPFGAACRDYDLFLKRTNDEDPPEVVTVASSVNVQNTGASCVPNADPVEILVYDVPVTDEYHLVVEEKVASTDAFLDLFSGYQDIEYRVSANSLLQPGDSADVTSVGAVSHSSPTTIEAFSSRGPTTDGRIKPDIVGPDGVSNATLGTFSGTSAAAPHVTGAAALLLQTLPCLSTIETGAFLEAQAVPLGTPGKDNTFGSGRLSLGALPTDADTDTIGDQCDNCPSMLNTAQANQDADTWGDLCDTCPTVATEWLAPPGDIDCDGFPTTDEATITTDPNDSCGFTPGGDPSSDTWPVDFVESNNINILDVTALKPVFGQSVPPASARYDIIPDAVVNILDVLILKPFFGKSCTP